MVYPLIYSLQDGIPSTLNQNQERYHHNLILSMFLVDIVHTVQIASDHNYYMHGMCGKFGN